jgi:hypothetical protein
LAVHSKVGKNYSDILSDVVLPEIKRVSWILLLPKKDFSKVGFRLRGSETVNLNNF